MQGTKVGPYRIVEQLGSGGMGEVFKAFDDRLDRLVAIKKIRPDKEEKDDSRERLRREARATAQLNHPAIVQVYDIFLHGDSDCIVMEFIEGKSLDQLIQDEHLEPARITQLGREIAGGLAEAHDKGILHRDLKTENIIVTPSGHAKILDFGLAKPVMTEDLDSSLTAHGQMVGTSRALSPEYAGGEDIDHRSDLFQLGVLLYETCTGHSPFMAHNTLATLKRVILHQQTPVHEVNPTIPRELSDLIDHLLEKDPTDRPSDARSVAAELTRIGGGSSGSIEETSTSLSSSSRARRQALADTGPSRRWIWAGASLLAILGLAGFLYLRLSQPEPPGDSTRQPDWIVVGEFDNQTGEAVLDSLETAFRAGLEQSRFTYVLPQSRVRQALKRMQVPEALAIDRELGLEICQRESARAFVDGRIVKVGDSYSLSAEIVDPGSEASIFSDSKTVRQAEQILPILDELTQAVRGKLGESLAAIEQNTTPLEKVTTSNLQALKAYSLGIEHLENGEFSESMPLLEQAIQLDNQFAMAHAKLGTAYRNLDRDRQLILGSFERALELSDRLTGIEKLYVEGWVAGMRGPASKMFSTWTLMSQLYPEKIEGPFNLGICHWLYRNDYESATQHLERANQLGSEGNRAFVQQQLGYTQLAQEQYEEAEATFNQAWNQAERPSGVGLMDLLISQRRYPEARQTLAQILAKSPPANQVDAYLRLSLLHNDRGNFEEAIREARRVTERAIELEAYRMEHVGRLTALTALERKGDSAAFQEALGPAINAARQLLETESEAPDFSPVLLLTTLGQVAARNGAVVVAERIAETILPLSQDESFVVRQANTKLLQGEIEAAKGQWDQAAQLFRQAVESADLFQAHESLARALEQRGDFDGAIREYEWLVEHRGRSFAECVDGCFDRSRNIIDNTLALIRLARLHERQGDTEQASSYYQRFTEQWSEGDELHPALVEARSRLAALRPADGA